MLRISREVHNERLVLNVEGSLRGPWVDELERVWEMDFDRAEQMCVNLADVSYVDDAGKSLLGRMFKHGTELTASGPYMQVVVKEITRGAARSGHRHQTIAR